ncbi:holo-ACP synthase [Luteolibacter ambystomatis]|uniref:Holo-[acyl-carrier-protein] synthase n=1 Tax=Luteolibacter ambystomatis TaxID=2824561 RepID=A0A975J1P8_9BACT|nr:holo-ACP synthase [Luteolibacter ambystomatis]QUE52410.1 holo-ACP synthase [Luteolibacter ambystomatis]
MRLIGIGIDVVEVQRIAEALERHGEAFGERIFTAEERRYCSSQKRPALHYAARFAAKEAVAKAFGTGIGKDLGWLDMEIIRRESGEPAIVLSGTGKAYAEANGITEVKISLTHARDYAAANAVALGA